jgi:CRP-like cAMP-binding protein
VDSIAYELGRDALTVLFNQRPEVLEELSSCLAERQLQNSDFLKTASETEVKTEMATLAQEFIGKIKRVFGFHKAHQEELRNKIH